MTAAVAYLLRALGGFSLLGGLLLARRRATQDVSAPGGERLVAALFVLGLILLAVSFGVSP